MMITPGTKHKDLFPVSLCGGNIPVKRMREY